MFLFLGFTLLVLVGILLVLTYRERYDPLQLILVLTMFATGQVFRTGATGWAAFLASAVRIASPGRSATHHHCSR